jgi:hypothetical protein
MQLCGRMHGRLYHANDRQDMLGFRVFGRHYLYVQLRILRIRRDFVRRHELLLHLGRVQLYVEDELFGMHIWHTFDHDIQVLNHDDIGLLVQLHGRLLYELLLLRFRMHFHKPPDSGRRPDAFMPLWRDMPAHKHLRRVRRGLHSGRSMLQVREPLREDMRSDISDHNTLVYGRGV